MGETLAGVERFKWSMLPGCPTTQPGRGFRLRGPGRRRRVRPGWIVTALATFALPLTAAQSPDPPAAPEPGAKIHHRVPRTELPVAIDGVLDDAAWQAALVLALPYEIRPGDNIAASANTEARLLYDDDHLYVSFRADDPDPSKIRARISDRDRAFQDDFVGLVVDTFNDERRAFEFFVNPLGVQMDLVQDDVSGNEDSSWDAIWKSAGRINGSGYDVEIAIPYTSLRFQRGQGDQVWGLDLIRIYPRDQRVQFASNRRDKNISCYLCQLDKIVGFDGAAPGKNLEFTPTLVAGRTESLDSFPNGRFKSEEDYEPGLTVRWGVTPNLTLSATANPDFSQVEADAAQLDVNRQFALFFSEKRPFFLEGADFFETPISAVYTRTVAEPSIGVKLTGKEGRHALGAIVARDDPDRSSLLIPGSERSSFASMVESLDAGVFRYRRDVGKNSAVGALLTAREGDVYHNRVAGVDTLVRPGESDSIRFQVLSSQTRYPDSVVASLGASGVTQPGGEFDGRAFALRYSHNERNWGSWARYEDFDEDFRADLGFVSRVGYRKAVAGGRYTWWQEPEKKFSWFEVFGDWDQTVDADGMLLEREVEASFLGSGPKQFFFQVGPGHRTRVFNGVEFSQDFLNAFFEATLTGDFYVNLSFGLSDREDLDSAPPGTARGIGRQGHEKRIEASMRYNFGRHLRADLSHEYRTLGVAEGALFRANVSELRLVQQFSVRMFVRAIVQYFDVERNPGLYDCSAVPQPRACRTPEARDLFGQLLFSYKLNPQTALFAGYTDSRSALQGTSLVQTDRTLFLKLTYAWVL